MIEYNKTYIYTGSQLVVINNQGCFFATDERAYRHNVIGVDAAYMNKGDKVHVIKYNYMRETRVRHIGSGMTFRITDTYLDNNSKKAKVHRQKVITNYRNRNA